MKNITEILRPVNPSWEVVDEWGNIRETFRLKTTAQQWIPKLKLNKREKLIIREKI